MERAIENKGLELFRLFEQISHECRKEKNANVPLNNLFYWWTRKPLALSRAMILLSTIHDTEKIKPFLHFDEEKRSFFYPIDKIDFQKKSSINPKQIRVFDPFAGSGNLIFEAARLGFDCVASDYNPVSYLILKSVFEYPKQYGDNLSSDIQKFGNQVIERTREDLIPYFDERIQSYAWVWCVKCPHCSQRIPLTNNMWISRKRRLGYSVKPDDHLDFKISLIQNISDEDAEKFTQKGGRAICIKCNNSLNYSDITGSIKNNKDRKLVFIKTNDIFRIVNKEDEVTFGNTEEFIKNNWTYLINSKFIPIDEIKPDPRSGIRNYGINYWHQYFSARQLVVFSSLIKNIHKVCDTIQDNEYRKVIVTYLSFLLGKHLDANSLGVHWHTGTEGPELTLSFRRTNFVFNHAEPNPFGTARGNLSSTLDDIVKAVKFCTEFGGNCKVQLGSTLDLSKMDKSDIIIADPPNPNDIQFSEQSEFFYVWMILVLSKYYPELPKSIPIDQDISDSPGRFDSKKISAAFYEKGLERSLVEMRNNLKDDGIILFLSSLSGHGKWDMLVKALRNAKLVAKSTHVIQLENITNIMPQLGVENLNTVLISCKKLEKEQSVFYEDLPGLIEQQIKIMFENWPLKQLIDTGFSNVLTMTLGEVLFSLTCNDTIKSFQKDYKINFSEFIDNTKKTLALFVFSKIINRSVTILGNQVSIYLFLRTFYDTIKVEELDDIIKEFSLDRKYLIQKTMIIPQQEYFKIPKLDEFTIEKKIYEVNDSDLFEQLVFLIQNSDALKNGMLDIKNNTNFKISELVQIVKSIIKIKSVKNQFDPELLKLNTILEKIDH